MDQEKLKELCTKKAAPDVGAAFGNQYEKPKSKTQFCDSSSSSVPPVRAVFSREKGTKPRA